VRLPAELPVRSYFASDAGDFGGERVQLVHHDINGVLQVLDLALRVSRDLLGEIDICGAARNIGDVSHLFGQVVGHRVDVVGQVLPCAGYAPYVRLAAELTLRTDLPSDAGHFGGEAVELVDHGIDRVLQLEDLAARVGSDLLGEI